MRGERPQDLLCDTVFRGLTEKPKRLPPRLFYDHEGSALFEAITDLPEYYPTRTEQAILQANAEEIIRAAGDGITMVEFGSGSSRKTRVLIEAALARQGSLHYVPIDISRSFLRESSETLLGEYPGLTVTAMAAEYFDAASALPSTEGPRLIIFLGSNIGNLTHTEAEEFLRRIRKGMKPHDRLLVGTDMVKDRAVLEAAYNDSQGITAKFNCNVLERVNRELGGHFDLSLFRHHAPYDDVHQRIEMRLVSLADQEVRIDALDSEFTFAKDEAIITEWSQKYTRESFAALCGPARLEITAAWTDERAWFTEYLLRPD
jgi:L-histidine N-alpha-methyltransferase